jgi:transcriptional regulator with AAA-type ATPase domain
MDDAAGCELVGNTDVMRALRREIRALAPLPSTVLITGETGVGKGLVARALHRHSGRGGASLVHVDCAAMASNLVESELFGHERGAFTGAVSSRIGRFELAAGGTLFLDEIGDLELALQGRLLRALQDREYERLGGNQTRALSARVVAATNRDLAEDVRAGRFRADLYYRLNVLALTVPPLRRRSADVPVLFASIADRLVGELGTAAPELSSEAAGRLVAHRWPGNVRELCNVVERLLVKSGGRRLDAADVANALDPLPFRVQALAQPDAWRGLRVRDAETPPHRIAEVLAASGGNVARAARRLGLPRSTLRHRLRRLGLRRGEISAGAPENEGFPQDQAGGDQGEDGLEQPPEPQLVDVLEQAAADPCAHDDHRAEDHEGQGVCAEGEARTAEDQDLGQVSQALGRGFRPDDAVPPEPDVQEERGEQGPRRPDGHVEHSDDTPEHQEPAPGLGLLGVRPEQQQLRKPGGDQDERPDHDARHRG